MTDAKLAKNDRAVVTEVAKEACCEKKSFKVCRVQVSFATEVSNSFTGRMLRLESWTLPAWIKVQVIRLPRFICIQITTEKQHVLKVDVERNYLNSWYSYIYSIIICFMVCRAIFISFYILVQVRTYPIVPHDAMKTGPSDAASLPRSPCRRRQRLNQAPQSVMGSEPTNKTKHLSN